jgi:hypothetical protein
VLDLLTAMGVDAFVQIWSEPFCELIVEVGPGHREDEARQSFANEISDLMMDRGFAIGGKADNFEKTLPVPSAADAPRVAREL